ncbi:MAG: hypothetical protein JNK16_02630 [Phycisphaerales bacterium]|nr:hypothetical protein [Phycisphaerales bacterium]
MRPTSLARFVPRLVFISAATILVAFPLGATPGCAGTELRSPVVFGSTASAEKTVGPAQLTPSQVQSEVMSFTDTFVSAVSQIWNAIASNARKGSTGGGLTDAENARLNSMRRASLEIKLANVNAALLIASSPNPLVALSDMITVVTLQRMVIEAPSTTRLFGAEIQGQLLEVYKEQEINVWKIADAAMTETQRSELMALIKEWRGAHPDATYVSSIRLDDFAAARQISVAPKNEKNPSLLSLLSLDPLAGLDPAQREITETRMLAERIFFYASRVPNVIKWQVESLYQGLMQAPEFQDILRSTRRASDAADEVAASLTKLPAQITAEREALFRQFFAELTKEREATINQINDALSGQRLAALKDLDSAQSQFQGTLKDFRETATSANTLAEKLTVTIQAADTLASRFAPTPLPSGTAPAPSSAKEGDGLKDFQTAADRTAVAAERLTELTKSIDRLLASPQLIEKGGGLQVVMRDLQGSGRELVNYAFWRLLIIVIVAPFSVVLAMGAYRKMVK